jgi:outer membrane protein OmpA-like peptidoglycan-associated protein
MRPFNAIGLMLAAAAVILLATRSCSLASGPLVGSPAGAIGSVEPVATVGGVGRLGGNSLTGGSSGSGNAEPSSNGQPPDSAPGATSPLGQNAPAGGSSAAAPSSNGQGPALAESRSAPGSQANPGAAAPGVAPPPQIPDPRIDVRTIVLGAVQFETNRAALSGDAESMLRGVAQSLKNIPPGKVVSIVGHTDAIGSGEANALLSQRRAEAVRNYLVEHGVSARLLSLSYVGASAPMASDASAEGRASNRRVVIQLQSTP